MKENYSFSALEKVGITVLDEKIIFQNVSGVNKQFTSFDELLLVELKKSTPSVAQIGLYWITTVVTFDMLTGTSWFGSRFDYRSNYDLLFNTEQGQLIKLTIKDFDLFQVSKELKQLNKIIKSY